MELGNRPKGKWIKGKLQRKKIAVDIATGTLPAHGQHRPEAQVSGYLKTAAPHFDKRILAVHQR